MSENTLGLAFEIAADPSKAIAGMEELNAAAVAEAGELTNIWSGAMKAITGPTGIALGVIVGLGGGMKELADKAAEAGTQIYEASEKTGMSAQALSGVRALANETGSSFESLSTAFARATVNLAKAADSGKGALTELFTTTELQSLRLKPVDEQMQTVLHRIFALTDAGERNRELQALLGRGWQDNIQVLKLLAEEGFSPAIERAKELGTYFDQDAAERARLYTLQIDHMKATWEGLSESLDRIVMPTISALFGLVFGSGDEWRIWSDQATVLIEIPFEKLFALVGKLPLVGEGFKESALEMKKAIDDLETDAALTEKRIEDRLKSLLPSEGGGGAGAGAGAAGAAGGTRGNQGSSSFLTYGPTLDQLRPKIDGITKATDGAIDSFALWELQQEKETYATLPLLIQGYDKLISVLSDEKAASASKTQVGTVASAANFAKIAIDGLAASFENAGGKSSAASQKFLQSAQAMAQMAQKAQDDADKGETVDPKQQIAGMVQIAAAAILTYKERAIIESVYYAAKSVAAFAMQDYWAGAEFALASGLFAEAAGTSSKASSGGGGGGSTGGNQSSYGGSPGSGGPGSGGGGGSRGPSIVLNQYGPMVGTMNDLAKALVNTINQLGTSGQVRLTAYNSLTNGAKQT